MRALSVPRDRDALELRWAADRSPPRRQPRISPAIDSSGAHSYGQYHLAQGDRADEEGWGGAIRPPVFFVGRSLGSMATGALEGVDCSIDALAAALGSGSASTSGGALDVAADCWVGVTAWP